ncbi:hypothetical protein [Agriterribacter sp.]|uniref:hypothetical protein n=1 Tax=Agriterribacter sp. TaxID=2821509 RepID=UPI002CAA7C82|nr:hypothetical protein [Agriterribacter sp.]HRP57196.1 hypothetical protein [Agriterribacter sp.]
MSHHNMLFLNQRIYEIGSALFYCMNTTIARIPATIINVLKIDEAGNLYTLIQRPEYSLTEDEMHFPALLKFYKKGKPFFMEVQGCATLLNDNGLLNQLMHWQESIDALKKENIIIIKLKMENIRYYEWKQPLPRKGIKGFITQVYQWLLGINPLSFSLNWRPVAVQQQAV